MFGLPDAGGYESEVLRLSRQWDEAAEKKRGRSRKSPDAFRGFVNHTLTKQDKHDYAQYAATRTFEEHALPALLGDGYKLSLSFDPRTGAFMAAITTKEAATGNKGLVLTARSGGDAFEAGLRVCFLHYHVFAEEWPDPQGQGEYVDEWVE